MMNTDELFNQSTVDNAMLARLPNLLLRRPALEDRLDSWASMTVIRGPQGYGKTTLVVSWLERLTSTRVIRVWVNAGPDLNERERFWRHVLRCFHTGPEHAVPEVPEALRALEGKLRSLHGYRIVLVIDRFDDIQDRDVIADVAELAQRQRNLYLYVCIRGKHLLETVGSGYTELTTIGPADLLLSESEVRRLAEVLGRPVSDEDAAAVHRACGGWVAASRRILESSPPDRLDLTLAYDYLRSTVLPHIGDRATLRGLMQVCLLERPPVRMIHDLFESPAAVLDTLDDLGLPELSHQRDGDYLSLPSLVHTVLRDEFSRQEPAAAREFHRRAGRWFAERTDRADSNAVEALRHLTLACAWDDLAQLWSASSTQLLTVHPDEARRILEDVPEQVLRRHPRLLVGQATVTALATSTRGDLTLACRAYIDTSEHLVRQSVGSLSLPDLLSVGTGYLCGQRAKGRFDAAERFAADLQDRITHGAVANEIPDGELAWFLVQRGLVHTLRGDDQAAIRCYRPAWDRSRTTPAHLAAPSAAANLAMTYAMRGEREQALLWLDRHREIDISGQWIHGVVGLGARIARAALALDELDQPAAAAELDHLGAVSADLELWPFVAFLDAVYGLHYGDPAAALANLTQTTSAHDGLLTDHGGARVLRSRASADLLMACGEGNRARQVIDRFGGSAEASTVSLARLHLLSGDHAAAGATATRLLSHPECPQRDHLELLLIKAVSALRRGDPGAAGRLFAHAIGRYRRNRVLRAFTTVPPDDLAALMALNADLLAPDEMSRLATVRPVFTKPVDLVQLTRQEQRVLVELERSQSNKDIAEALYVSVSTVKTQLHAIYRKLGTATRRETILRAHELTLLPHRPAAN
jgi:LuxR family maltose regulon positive regulatory protein